MNRRNFLSAVGAAVPLAAQTAQEKKAPAAAAAPKTAAAKAPVKKAGRPLDLSKFVPKSQLRVAEHPVERAKYPVVDVHTHITWEPMSTPDELLAVMDRRNLQTLVNLTGGNGEKLRRNIARLDKAHPGRFVTFTEPAWDLMTSPDYEKKQVELLEQAKQDGAHGLKVLKRLGLVQRDQNGKLFKVDDPRFDAMWDACGRLGFSVSIHVSDPLAFFDPIDPHNERFEELNNHPDWSFHGKDFPTNDEILEARDRMIARHPNTKFTVLHVGNCAEDLARVSRMLETFPNTNVEIGARIGELGRQPRTAAKFFEKYQDRIMFGTDATPNGFAYPQQLYGDALYQIYFRFLETEDEYFDYAPAEVPPQGRWRIYGLGLSDEILKKVYHDNAARLLGLQG